MAAGWMGRAALPRAMFTGETVRDSGLAREKYNMDFSSSLCLSLSLKKKDVFSLED